jgi:hypothetical protein
VTPGWRWIVVEGRKIWAYVGAGKIEAHAAPPGVPMRATIDGDDYVIQVTRIGAASFEADIIGRIADALSVAPAQSHGLPPAPCINEDKDHGE